MHKFLFSERLKRAALFVLLVCVAGTAKSLAQTQVATLQHGEETTAFYGINAFVQAHEAAESGDIITLSSGNFAPTDITKGITLRGAGCTVDTLAGTLPTIIGADITLDVEDETCPLSIEGILFTNAVYFGILANPTFTRCNFVMIDDYTGNMTNAQFINCFVNTFAHYDAYGTQFVNCVVWYPIGISTDSPASFVNSILRNNSFTSGILASNSIIVGDYFGDFASTSSFINCIGIQLYVSYSVFDNGYTLNCAIYNNYDEVFESFTGFTNDYTFDSFSEQFILKDEIATGFLGTDGTQVGIYGGFVPYTPYPNYMVRSQVTVAPRSTIDGQLNIEVEVIEEGE
jgi:hypothetical protein